ncbi:hypothetical protein [Chitinophaga japonensis]|uniref:YhhN-like protein n=1 Tax=Chitinophaga japonensis TaxID=104662 RepID=A0A562SM29_CHIJA|nr:hypothetical protein [Chitinophaga japonensis]TWI82401.1 hypothetical protein LX66_4973 [Chitinophaga japonensis]
MLGIECLILIPFTLHRRVLDKAGQWAYYYLISSVIFAAGSALLAKLFHNNLWFLSIMHFVQFIILSKYYQLIIKSPLLKKVIKILLVPVVIIFFLDILKLEGIMTYNSIFATIRASLLLCYGIIFFIQLLFDEDLVREAIFINILPDFWFNAGLFIFFSCSFFQALTYNFFLRHSIPNVYIMPYLIFISGIIEGILFYIGLLKAKRQYG